MQYINKEIVVSRKFELVVRFFYQFNHFVICGYPWISLIIRQYHALFGECINFAFRHINISTVTRQDYIHKVFEKQIDIALKNFKKSYDVIGNRIDVVMICATAAGPAFEGANISCGTGAFEGAISNYMDGKTVTISNVNPIGICGSALIDIIITQQDIREVQLAKGAIAAGTGALLSLKSDKFISLLNDLIGKTSYIELSYEDSFPEKFALNMDFKQKSTN